MCTTMLSLKLSVSMLELQLDTCFWTVSRPIEAVFNPAWTVELSCLVNLFKNWKGWNLKRKHHWFLWFCLHLLFVWQLRPLVQHPSGARSGSVLPSESLNMLEWLALPLAFTADVSGRHDLIKTLNFQRARNKFWILKAWPGNVFLKYQWLYKHPKYTEQYNIA